jgi:tRNA pseudouridine38-40 synthase
MEENRMKNFKLTIEYDGTDYHGWQIQSDRKTVQGRLYRAFHEIAGDDVKITGAGRTDAGVHAVGQVASVRLETKHSPTVLRKALTAKLPKDILIRKVEKVPLSFSARFDATSRSYDYIFITRKTALWRRYYHYVKTDLDRGAMRDALASLRGKKDFASFASSSDIKSTRCYMMKADLLENGPLLTISLTADHFLYNMVRTIAGVILDVGMGKNIDMDELIEARDRRAAGRTMPPNALYFMSVTY